ncbi:DUF3180 domain-containing protein [Brachybacterium endophyticum]|uniref:DUF3180 domain-containing protein n=1 Tax=Brachybacterium endophyticum TaxID=2182385 RepID=A0A2U2RM69_9MICO|nr:DUF3180 domain-containing protein [Brachybacterium endophyticum]PWH06936.1 DUF3180 domain-containing protein [Brachybacterium endophyticum]
MRPVSVPTLGLLGALATLFGVVLSRYIAGRGAVFPVTGWFTGLLLLVIAAVLLIVGIPLRRYMKESEERVHTPTIAPRRHHIDMITAYRIVVLARACAYTGTIVGGIQLGQFVFLAFSGIGSPVGALLPTGFAALCGAVLAVLGVIVERWGTLPPDDGDSEGAAHPSAS